MTDIKLKIFILTILPILLVSCSQKERQISSRDELYGFLNSLEKRYENACAEIQLIYWNEYSGKGASDSDRRLDAFREIFSDTVSRNVIEEWRKKSESLADKPLARRLELWHRCFIGGIIYTDDQINKLEDSLQNQIADYRKKPGYIIPQDENKQFNSRLTGTAAGRYLQLIKLLNKNAQVFGFPDYYSLSLYLQATDERWLLKTLNSVENMTRPDYIKALSTIKKKLRLKKFEPSDVEFSKKTFTAAEKYFKSDSVQMILHKFEKEIGFNFDSLPVREFFGNHSYQATCFSLSTASDIRLLIKPGKGPAYYSEVLKGYGTAKNVFYTNVEYPILKGYRWIPGAFSPSYYEGVAQMNGEFVTDSLWLTAFTHAKEKEIKQFLTGTVIIRLLRLRQALTDFYTEYEIYKHPEASFDSVYTSMLHKYLLCSTEEKDTFKFIPPLKFVLQPCGSHTAVLSDMIAAQLQEALSSKFGNRKISNPRVAQWIIEHLYSSGEMNEWYERIRNATGKSLEPGAYLRKLEIEQKNLLTKEKR